MVKPLARGLAFLALSLLLVLGGVGLWLKQDVRTLAWVKPRLEAALNPPGAPYKISTGDVSLDWRHLSRLGRIRVNGMVVTLLDGTAFAAVPQVEVTIDPFGFLPRHNALNSIILIQPKLYLTRTEGGVIRMGLQEQGQSLPLNDLLGYFAGSSTAPADAKKATPHLPFRAIAVEGASMTLKDEVSGGASLLSSPFTFRLAKHTVNGLSGLLVMPFVYNGTSGEVDARLSGSLTSRNRMLSMSLSKFPIELACQFGACPEGFSGSGLVSGKANMEFTRHFRLVGGDAAIRALQSTFAAPKFFPEPLKLSVGTISAHLWDDGQNVLVDNAKLAFEDVNLAGRGQLITRGKRWRLIMHGNAGKLSVTKLYKYWPLVLAGDSREWVTSKLKGGYAASASVALDINDQMYATNQFTPDAVHSIVDARDIDVEYLAGFPEVKHTNGIARFVGNTLRIDGSGGSMLSGTKINSALLTADDLHHPNAPMVADLRLTSPAADVVTLLALEHFSFDDDWKLDPKAIKGSADVSMKLGFDSFSNDPSRAGINFDRVTYDITANVKDLAQPKVLGRMDINDLSGTLHTSNKTLSFDGKLGVTPTTGLRVQLAQAENGHTSADISGTLPRTEFAAIGIADDKRFGAGNLGIDAHFDLGKNSMRPTHARLDLTDIVFDLPEISWSKARGEKGTLTLSAKEGGNKYALALDAKDLEVKDAVLTTDDTFEVKALSLPRVFNSRNDFALDYQVHADGGFAVSVSGKKLDAETSFGASDNSLLADFPPMTLNVNLDEMTLMPQVPLKNVKGNLTCNTQRCESMDLSARTSKGTVRATITKPKNRREFALEASDAGELLKALDVTDRLYDGKLQLTGKYDDTRQPAPLNARLLITDFSLKNSQILGRIISLASITGVGDAITGSTSFSKLGADVSHLNGVVTLRNGRADGSSIGITLEGKVDTNTTDLRLKGVLVPANLINSLFTKIPIIGKLAGKEGEGLIAFNYSVEGKYSDPEVNVNPLSGLTPGVLRNVFNGSGSDKTQAAPAPYPGDRPAPSVAAPKKKPAAQKPATD